MIMMMICSVTKSLPVPSIINAVVIVNCMPVELVRLECFKCNGELFTYICGSLQTTQKCIKCTSIIVVFQFRKLTKLLKPKIFKNNLI